MKKGLKSANKFFKSNKDYERNNHNNYEITKITQIKCLIKKVKKALKKRKEEEKLNRQLKMLSIRKDCLLGDLGSCYPDTSPDYHPAPSAPTEEIFKSKFGLSDKNVSKVSDNIIKNTFKLVVIN